MRIFTTTASRRGGLLGAPAVVMAAGAALAACSGGSPSAVSSHSASTKPVAAKSVPAPVDDVAIQIQTGKQDGKPGWPRFFPAAVTVHHGDTVRLTITNYDDGSAPLNSALTSYDHAQGGTETVDGVATTSVDNSIVAHTWTVPALGLNAVVPEVPSGSQTNTIVFTFKAGAPGTYVIKCFAPCGSGSDGMEGAMATQGWMQGTLTIS